MRGLPLFMNVLRPRLPSVPSPTRRSFAVLGAAAAVCKDVPAEQPETATVPTAAALRADGDLVQRTYEALHPGYNTPVEVREHFDALRKELEAAASFSDWRARAYLALARMKETVRCGHTYANFYNQCGAVRRNLLEGTNRVPCEFRWLDGRMVVTRDLSTE